MSQDTAQARRRARHDASYVRSEYKQCAGTYKDLLYNVGSSLKKESQSISCYDHSLRGVSSLVCEAG